MPARPLALARRMPARPLCGTVARCRAWRYLACRGRLASGSRGVLRLAALAGGSGRYGSYRNIPDLCRISFSGAVTSMFVHCRSSRRKCHCVVILSLLSQLLRLLRCGQCSFHLRQCNAVTCNGATFSQLAACRFGLDKSLPDLTVMHHSTVGKQAHATQNHHHSTVEPIPDLKLF